MLVKNLKKKIIKLYQDGHKISQISAFVNLSRPTILKYLKGERIPIKNTKKLHLDIYDIDKAVELYIAGHSLSYIEEFTKLSEPTIHKYIKKAGVPLRRNWERPDKDEIKKAIDLYKEGFELSHIAKETNISTTSIRRYLKKEKIPLRKKEKSPIDNLKQQRIFTLYKKGFSLKHIKEVTKLSRYFIIKCLEACGIPTRSRGGVCIDKKKIEKAIKLYKEGNSLQNSVQKVQISIATLSKYLKEAEIPTRRRVDKEKLKEAMELYKNGHSFRSAGKITGIHENTILNHTRAAGIPIRNRGKKVIRKEDIERAVNLYKKGNSLRVCAESINVSSVTLSKYFKAAGISFKKRGNNEKIEKVLELYKNGRPLKDIEQNTKLTINTILKYVKASGIPRRNKEKKYIRKEDIEKAGNLYKKGNSLRICAESINISLVTLLKYFKAEGIYFKRRRINNEKIEKILELYKNGEHLKDIAKNTDLSIGTIVRYIRVSDVPRRGKGRRALNNINMSASALSRYLKKNGFVIKRKAGKIIDKEKIRKALELYKEGHTLQYTADAVKMKRSTLAGYIYKTKIPKRRIRQSPEDKKTTVENILRLYKEGFTYRNISQSTNMSMSTVYKYIRESGILVTRKRVRFFKEKLEKALELYKKDYEISDIEKITSISKASILKYAKIANIPRRKKGNTRISRKKIEQIIKLYEEGYKLSYISKLEKVSQASIVKYAKVAGLPPRELKGPRVSKEKVEKALQLYIEGYSLSHIRDTVNISKGSISKYVKIRGLPTRGKINN